MGGYRISLMVQHIIGVSVVGRQQDTAAHSRYSLNNSADAAVYRLHRLYRRIENACMAYHVCIGKIEND